MELVDQSLADRLADRIRREGPITFRDWMAAALYDESHGYYCRKDLARWGKDGDYRTSPESSVLFAAVFARYFAQVFEDLGSPERFTIVELGSGAGHFARGVLETLRDLFPSIFERTTYVIDEISSDARARARDYLSEYRERVQFVNLAEMNQIDPGIVFSNELIDAFPIHRIGMTKGQLVEFYVGLTGHNTFEWRTGPLSTEGLMTYLERFQIQLQEDQNVEINLGLEEWFIQVANKLRLGYLVTVDYGAEADELYSSHRQQGTLRTFRKHTLTGDILSDPGTQDITSSVNWTALMQFGDELGFKVCKFERQDRFLLEQGLLSELELKVSQAASEGEKVELRLKAREMVLPGGMAQSFRVLIQRKG